MTKSRLEAFSDGVLAIIITIMVLEMKVPHEATWQALAHLGPIFISYTLSFVYVGIYWVNHHHIIHTVHHVTPGIMWTNLALLFTLSLIPFTTGFTGENHWEKIPSAVYGINLMLCAVAYYFLQMAIQKHHEHETQLIIALKKQEKKGIASLILYVVAIPCAFLFPWVSTVIHFLVAIWWIIPDRNIDRALRENQN